jgi:hypothetical protein
VVTDIQSWTFQTTIPKHNNSQPQRAAGGPAAGRAPALTAAALAPVALEAVALWAASGLSAAQVAQLRAVHYQIGALNGGVLGLTALGSSVVTLDATAAGYGWFVGPTAGDPAFGSGLAPLEVQAGPDSPAFGRMDLLTVVEHELGHVLGLGDLDPHAVPHDLLTETLAPGVRRLPTPAAEGAAPPPVRPPEALPSPSVLAAPPAPLTVTLPAAPAAPALVAAPAPDESLPAAGDGAPRGMAFDVAVQALDGWLLGDLSQPPDETSVLAGAWPDTQAVADGRAAAALVVPLAPEPEWLRTQAAVRPADGQPNDGRDALFAQLGEQADGLDLLGGDPGAAPE